VVNEICVNSQEIYENSSFLSCVLVSDEICVSGLRLVGDQIFAITAFRRGHMA
jgi:hypothetical protein